MHLFFIPLLAASFLILAGCADPVPYSETKTFTESKTQMSYTPGEVIKRYTGEEILSVRRFDVNTTESLAYRLNAPVTGLVEEITFDPAEEMVVVAKGSVDNKESYLIRGSRYTKNNIPYEVYIEIFPSGRLASRSITIKNMKYKTSTSPLYFSYKTVGGVKFEKGISKESIPLKGTDTKWTLSYSGNDGASIRLFYKEYLDDFTRPLFTQELSYPAGSRTIRYKNIRLEVLKADGQSIEFRVIGE